MIAPDNVHEYGYNTNKKSCAQKNDTQDTRKLGNRFTGSRNNGQRTIKTTDGVIYHLRPKKVLFKVQIGLTETIQVLLCTRQNFNTLNPPASFVNCVLSSEESRGFCGCCASGNSFIQLLRLKSVFFASFLPLYFTLLSLVMQQGFFLKYFG